MPRSILIVDDETTLAKNIGKYLTRHGYDTKAVSSGEDAIAELETFIPDIVLLDYQLGDIDGLEVLKQMRDKDVQTRVIMMTGNGSVQVAVDAMKAGACDYVTKPLVLEALKLQLEKAIGHERLKGTVAYYQRKQAEQAGVEQLLGDSEPIRTLRQKIRRFLDAEQRLRDGDPPTVLVSGETGTGKELVAKAFHFDGPRKDKPFVEINCASIPAHLMEAELLGFERGAFTDAKERKPGLIETAEGGTLFLDEIGEMDLELQAKLLQFLENRTVRRLGGVREQRVNVRVVAATNQDLEERIGDGRFRADLFYRLRIVHLHAPALRDRADDVDLLATHFLKLHAGRYGKEDLKFSTDALAAIRRHSWPGNVRELRNVIEQSVLLAERGVVEVGDLALSSPTVGHHNEFEDCATNSTPMEGSQGLQDVEVACVKQALERTSWNVTQAAKLLGISRDTLRYRIRKFDLRENPGFPN